MKLNGNGDRRQRVTQALLLGVWLLPAAARAQPPAPVVPLAPAAPAGQTPAAAWPATDQAITYHVDLVAPLALTLLLQNNLAIIKQQTNSDMTLPYLQRLYQDTPAQVTQLLNTEGYYKPDIRISMAQAGSAWTVKVQVTPGELTHVRRIDIRFGGPISAVSAENQHQVTQARAQWAIKPGDVFRQEQWEAAKRALLVAVQQYRFPAARISSSQATVNPQDGQADLSVVIDSGPVFTFGDLKVAGLQRYPLTVVRNLSEIKANDPYDQRRLTALQNKLQSSSYFQTAAVTAPADPAHPQQVPINVTVVERRAKHLNMGAGYGSDTGPRVRAGYQDLNLFGKGWRLDNRAAMAQNVQVVSSGIIMPTNQPGVSNAIGAEYAHLNIQNDNYQTVQAGVSRSKTRGDITQTLAENMVVERDSILGVPAFSTRALFTNYTWTRQHVDNLLDPQRGFILSGQLGGGLKSLGSNATFVRAYAKGSWFHPLGPSNTLALRVEAGAVNAASSQGIPTALLFRTGGVQSVRGYDYLSLGPRLGNAVVGGRYLAVASAEVDHWFSQKYGGALFMDAGNAADSIGALQLKKSLGAGFRWRSPLGLVRVDVAHALDPLSSGIAAPRVRVDASLGYTF